MAVTALTIDKPDFFETLKALPTSTLPEVEIYTDGACSGNPGPGGWGATLSLHGIELDLSGGEKATTNNRMEMMAAIEALKALPRKCKVALHTDSKYLKDGITLWMTNWKRNGWITSQKTPVKNKELWEQLDAQILRHEVSWHWVKGHAGHPKNEHADSLARNAIIALQMRMD